MSQRSSFKFILLLGSLSAFAPMSIDMYLPALPAMARDFAVEVGAVQHTLAAFFIGIALGQLVYGPVSDAIGRRRPLLFGTGLYVLASIGCALAPTIESLIALRFVQALGGCAGMVIGRAVVRDLYTPQEAGRVYSLLMLVMGVAPILAPTLGSSLLLVADWRWIFGVLVLFGAACLIASARMLPETRPVRLAPVGGVLRSYAAVLADRRFLCAAIAGGFSSAGLFTYISGSPAVLIEQYGLSPQAYGIAFGGTAAALIAGAQVNRHLLKTRQPAAVFRAATLLLPLLGLTVLAVGWSGLGGAYGLIGAIFLQLTAYGFILPNSAAVALTGHPERAGAASALLGTFQFGIGGAVSSLLGPLYDGTPLAMCGLMAAVTLVSCAAGRLLPRAP